MTRLHRQQFDCPRCGHRATFEAAISRWIRDKCLSSTGRGDRLFVNDLDLLFHAIKDSHVRLVEYFMVVEVKTHGADSQPSQRDSLDLLSQFTTRRSCTPTKSSKPRQAEAWQPKAVSLFKGRKVHVRPFGVHTLRLSGTDPDNSERILWDGKGVSADQVRRLFNFELDPDTLQPMNNRSHHKPKQRPLIDGCADGTDAA